MSALQKFSETHDDRRVIEDFIEWLSQHRMEIGEWRDDSDWLQVRAEKPDALLMRYFEIDPVQLDRERRELLELQRR